MRALYYSITSEQCKVLKQYRRIHYVYVGPDSHNDKRVAIWQDHVGGRGYESHRSRVFSKSIFFPRASNTLVPTTRYTCKNGQSTKDALS